MVENRLQHLSRHEHEPEHGEEQGHDGDDCRAEAGVSEQAEVQHRVVRSAFPTHERHEPDDGEPEAGDDDGLGPSPLGALGDRIQKGGETDDRQPGADRVEPTGGGGA